MSTLKRTVQPTCEVQLFEHISRVVAIGRLPMLSMFFVFLFNPNNFGAISASRSSFVTAYHDNVHVKVIFDIA